jgi:REP element-mobilizing transposase RayT
MSNHVHLLLTPNQPDDASRVFRDLGRDYVSSRSEPLIESIDALSVGFS